MSGIQVIRPGDTVLVRIADMNVDAAARVTGVLKERLPGIEVVVLGGVDGIDVYRPDSTEDVPG